jgi:transcriptional regulator with XRE-family HTH domain
LDFHEKLQELRKKRGLTQEELASALYVSRTAISKWESGRGYPSIDSLKALARFYGVTVDELLSSEAVLSIAEEEQRGRARCLRGQMLGLLDLSVLLLLLLPLFAERTGEEILAVSLLSVSLMHPLMRGAFFATVILSAMLGASELLLGGMQIGVQRWQEWASLFLGVLSAMLFALTLHPYAATFSILLCVFRVFLLIRRH